MELRLGKMSSKEIATWMGLSYNTYSNKISKYLEKLKIFADFEAVYGGVIIKNIKIATYVKDFNKDITFYYEEIKSKSNRMGSASGAARVGQTKEDEYAKLAPATVEHRMRNAKKIGFGDASDSNSKGIYGTCHYTWAVMIDDMNNYRDMTIEERKKYNTFLDLYCQSLKCKNSIERTELIKQAYEDGDIGGDAAMDLLMSDKEFRENVLDPLRMETGITLVKTTQHELFEDKNSFDER